LQYCPPVYSQVFRVVIAPQNSPPKLHMHLPCLLFMPRAPAISFLSVRLHADYNYCHNKRTNTLLNRKYKHAHTHTHVYVCVDTILM